MTTVQEKKTIRDKLRIKLSQLTINNDIETKKIVSLLKNIFLESCPDIVLGYSACQHEVDLAAIYDWLETNGVTLAFPRFNSQTQKYDIVKVDNWRNQLKPAKYNILEPLPELQKLLPESIKGQKKTWLVPGVAFSKNGARLGRGKGFYDNLLNNIQGEKIGIAWDCQIIPFIPEESHDIKMDMVLTETGKL